MFATIDNKPHESKRDVVSNALWSVHRGAIISAIALLGLTVASCGDKGDSGEDNNGDSTTPVADECSATVETRTRYIATTVPDGDTCVSEVQARVCSAGEWSPWSGSFTAEACTVLGPVTCGDVANGTVETRTRFEASTVPMDETCQEQTQSRLCSGGEWASWSGTFTAETCEVTIAAPIIDAITDRVLISATTLPGNFFALTVDARVAELRVYTGASMARSYVVVDPGTSGEQAGAIVQTTSTEVTEAVDVGGYAAYDRQSYTVTASGQVIPYVVSILQRDGNEPVSVAVFQGPGPFSSGVELISETPEFYFWCPQSYGCGGSKMSSPFMVCPDGASYGDSGCIHDTACHTTAGTSATTDPSCPHVADFLSNP